MVSRHTKTIFKVSVLYIQSIRGEQKVDLEYTDSCSLVSSNTRLDAVSTDLY